MRLRDKIYYLEKAKVDVVIVAKFDRTFAEQPADVLLNKRLLIIYM